MAEHTHVLKPATPHIDEATLVSRLKAQDTDALGYLYDHYSGALYGVVLRIVKKEDIAEEVLQDAFLKIWNAMPQYDAGKGRLFTWMFNVARNLAIDKLRSREIKRDIKTDAVSDNVRSIDHQYYSEQSVDSIGLERLLEKLSEDQQLIIRLLYLQGYTQSEVAKEWGIPLGTVKTRQRLAMIQLRKLVGK
ncbi:RNA polymerase sigma factor [Cesiribacter andamanensis]|uniref:Sigma-K factor n=1 Tax=Cesiribacter andamanensis AMV16 TaxID=1279009 RepID=M7NAN8_9BACT|nr:sigma-70 family RNA polymerase sigma factor [Cesiribacter andamanensis]EMR04251.1 Sigma-K factor [Cesiribacter andamanensis AMV16]